jgi:DNA replication licensing factor MCM6
MESVLSPRYGTKHSARQITPDFVREAYALLRQSIIHVEQDDIEFDEDESKDPEGGAGGGGEDSQDVEMSGADVDTTDPSFSESAPLANTSTFDSSGGALTSLPRGRHADPAPPAPRKEKENMRITHDKWGQLKSLIVLHLSQVEQATGKGVDKEELIDWYLEFKESEIQDEEAIEYEKELITKVLKKLVKVGFYPSHGEDCADVSP